MEAVPIFVGIDVAKEHLDLAVRPTQETWQVPHDDQSIQEIVPRLQGCSQPW
jgi:hypothetical protein